jgi:hypothetical protein
LLPPTDGQQPGGEKREERREKREERIEKREERATSLIAP